MLENTEGAIKKLTIQRNWQYRVHKRKKNKYTTQTTEGKDEPNILNKIWSYLGCSVRLYLQLFVGGFMSYLGCSVRLYLQLFVGGYMSYLGCSVRLYLQMFVGGFMSCKDELNILNKT
jgi:hypothetical protein